MTSFSRGDIVLVKFVFADEKGAKQRSGLIVSADRYHGGRREAILAAITSNVRRLLTVNRAIGVGPDHVRATRSSTWSKNGGL